MLKFLLIFLSLGRYHSPLFKSETLNVLWTSEVFWYVCQLPHIKTTIQGLYQNPRTALRKQEGNYHMNKCRVPDIWKTRGWAANTYNLLVLIVNLIQCTINWEEYPLEGLSTLGWPVGMSIRDCLGCVTWCGKTQSKSG